MRLDTSQSLCLKHWDSSFSDFKSPQGVISRQLYQETQCLPSLYSSNSLSRCLFPLYHLLQSIIFLISVTVHGVCGLVGCNQIIALSFSPIVPGNLPCGASSFSAFEQYSGRSQSESALSLYEKSSTLHFKLSFFPRPAITGLTWKVVLGNKDSVAGFFFVNFFPDSRSIPPYPSVPDAGEEMLYLTSTDQKQFWFPLAVRDVQIDFCSVGRCGFA